LENIENEIYSLKNNVAKLNDRVINIEKFVKIDSTGIEEEITKNVKKYLYNTYQGSIIRKCNLKNIIDPITNKQITELDGAFYLTFNNYLNKKIKDDRYKFLVLIEAKHHITINQINEKIVQIYKIKKYLDLLKNKIPKDKYTPIIYRKIIGTIKHLQINYLNKQLYLFIGGPTWEKESLDYCKNINKGTLEHINWKNKTKDLNNDEEKEILEYLKNHIITIVPSGMRYEINDFEKSIKIDNILEEEDLILKGGNKKFIGYEMVILPNYMNITYT